jgi:hypothetical protein
MENAAIGLRKSLSEAGSDSIGLFYYAGHGLEMGGVNYLIPADANIPDGFFLRERAFSVQVMLDMLNSSSNALNIVVLDACRDFPAAWSRSLGRGLAIVTNPPANHIIMYATGAGSVAIDGQGRNGLFTSHLINNLIQPLDVNEIFRRTMGDVARASNNEQRPALYTDFAEALFFGEQPALSSQMQPLQPVPAQPIYIYQNAPDPEAWKNKWVYIGAVAGGGMTNAAYRDESIDPNQGMMSFGFLAEFNILPFFAMEVNGFLGSYGKTLSFLPILAKAGYRFNKIEAFFDIGFTIYGGFTVGGTFGVNLGPGVLFTKVIAIPVAISSSNDQVDLNSAYIGLIGYKVGFADKRKK